MTTGLGEGAKRTGGQRAQPGRRDEFPAGEFVFHKMECWVLHKNYLD
jgi:hypothetical protein